MKKKSIYLTFIVLMSFTFAQKDIVLSDDLASNSEALKVKMGTQWMGKIWKFKFGNYSVGKSKNRGTIQSYKSNFLNTKASTKTTQKFSFVLNSGGSDIAKVDAATNINFEATRSMEIIPFFSVGEDKVLIDSENFSALITVNEDTTDTWFLILNVSSGEQVEDRRTAYFSNGKRMIHLMPLTSNKKGEDNRAIPALGYEFIEPGKSLCAVQYYGGGMMGSNKNIIWLHNDLDQRMKLILAAAMTAVLQIKTGDLSFGL